jgi:hypothetical protein
VTGAEELDAEGLEAAYLGSVIEVMWGHGHRTRLEARPAGTRQGSFPEGVQRIHVITAWNPRSRRASPAENADRDRQLRSALRRVGWRHLDALGRSPDGSWCEDSHAVVDADPQAVLELARRFDQHAVYEWTAEHLAVRWTDDPARSTVRGWTSVTTP